MKLIQDPALLQRLMSSQPYTGYFGKQYHTETRILEYQAGEAVVHQGQPSAYLHLMISGRCSVSTDLPNGKTVILHALAAPALIGEMEILRDVSAYHVHALESCRMLSIPVSSCKALLLNDAFFLRAVCSDIIGKERTEALKLIHSLGYPLEIRLAGFILDNRQGNLFLVKKVHIAESLGVSYRHIETVMNRFVERGFLNKNGLIYTITDKDALKGLSRQLQ